MFPGFDFSEASSIDFKNSTVYGLKTLGALVKYTNQCLGIKRYPLFERNNMQAEKPKN